MFEEIQENLLMAYKTIPGRYVITYIIVNDEHAVLIDPSKQVMDDVARALRIKHLKMEDVKGVLITHGHGHHWDGISRVKQAEIYAPPCEVFVNPKRAIEIYGFDAARGVSSIKEYHEVSHGQKIKIGKEEFIPFYTGGHSKDHYIYIHIGTGMLFAGSIVGEFVDTHFKFFIDKSGSYENRQKFFEAIIGARLGGICPSHTFPVIGQEWKVLIRESYKGSKRVYSEVVEIAKKLKKFRTQDVIKELEYRLGFSWSPAEKTISLLTMEAILKHAANEGEVVPVTKNNRIVSWQKL